MFTHNLNFIGMQKELLILNKDKPTIAFHMPVFNGYLVPDGFLLKDLACHALWYYYLIARGTYETHVLNPIVYEGDKDDEFNFQQMFSSVATSYGVQPEVMIKFWNNIDLQCWALELPELPKEDKYRFNATAEIKTQ